MTNALIYCVLHTLIHIYCVLHTIPLFANCVSHTVKIYYFTVCKCAHAATNAISNPVNHVSSRLTQEKFSSTTPRSDEDMNSLVNCLPSHIHAVLAGQVGHKFWGVYSARAMAVLQAPSDQVYAAFTESADHLKRCQLSKSVQARKRPENPVSRQPRDRLLKRMKPALQYSPQTDEALRPPDESFVDTNPVELPTLRIPDHVPPSPTPQLLSEFLASLVSNGLVRVLDDNATATKIVWNAYDDKGTFQNLISNLKIKKRLSNLLLTDL